MPHRIQPGLRYRLAQAFLFLLYGRPWHFISLWKRAGVSATVFPVNKNRVLLGQRAGSVEHLSRWSGLGGFVETSEQESLAQAAAREVWEESGLLPNAEKFPTSPHAVFISYNQQKHFETIDVVAVYYYFEVADDFLKKLEPQEETADFGWFTEHECEAMIEDGRIPPDFTDTHAAIRELFRRLNAGEKLSLLPL